MRRAALMIVAVCLLCTGCNQAVKAVETVALNPDMQETARELIKLAEHDASMRAGVHSPALEFYLLQAAGVRVLGADAEIDYESNIDRADSGRDR